MAGGGEAAARDSLATDDGQESGSDAPAPAAAKVGVSPRCACNSHASDSAGCLRRCVLAQIAGLDKRMAAADDDSLSSASDWEESD